MLAPRRGGSQRAVAARDAATGCIFGSGFAESNGTNVKGTLDLPRLLRVLRVVLRVKSEETSDFIDNVTMLRLLRPPGTQTAPLY